MIRRFALVPLASLAVLTLAGCSYGDGSPTNSPAATSSPTATGESPTASPVDSPAPQEAPSPTPSDDPDAVLDLTGDWKQTNSASTDSWQAATIADGMITVLWVSDGGDTTSLYWAGTFEAPEQAGATYKWKSVNDHSQTDGATLASDDEKKEFSYADGVLSYKVSALGTTTKVELQRAQQQEGD